MSVPIMHIIKQAPKERHLSVTSHSLEEGEFKPTQVNGTVKLVHFSLHLLNLLNQEGERGSKSNSFL